jgi:hypothetical protein
MLRHVILVRTDVSEDLSASIIRVTRSSSETSVFTSVTRRNIPEDAILHSHRRENLKSYTVQRLATGWITEGSQFRAPAGSRIFIVHIVQTGSGAHTTSYPMATGGPLPGGKTECLEADHLKLVPRSRSADLTHWPIHFRDVVISYAMGKTAPFTLLTLSYSDKFYGSLLYSDIIDYGCLTQ